EATLRLIAFATAAGSSRDVLSLLVRGAVGDGPGLELLASLDRMELPDPESLLADPAHAALPERGDLRQAALDAVVAAVRTRPERARWDAAWALLVRAMQTGAPDVVVVPATTLASLRREDWEVPAAVERLAGVVSLSRRADEAARRAARTVGSRR
ncbi:AAA family ATPase, partial [Streptomyces broussonetiae]